MRLNRPHLWIAVVRCSCRSLVRDTTGSAPSICQTADVDTLLSGPDETICDPHSRCGPIRRIFKMQRVVEYKTIANSHDIFYSERNNTPPGSPTCRVRFATNDLGCGVLALSPRDHVR